MPREGHDAGIRRQSGCDEELEKLNNVLPRLGAGLRRAHDLRQERIAALRGGARFRGLDQLLKHLDDVAAHFRESDDLHQLSFLIARSTADFETAVEAALSGYLAVAIDAMRDVMEIENLLLDFAIDPTHIDDWLLADSKTLRTKYAPAKVRNRLHAAGEGRFASNAEAPDYRAHSEALHVRPGRHPIAPKGFSADAGWDGDGAYWEIFEHARRLLHAIRRLASVLSPHSDADRLAQSDLLSVDDAWRRTQEMQTVYVAVIEASADATPSLTDEP